MKIIEKILFIVLIIIFNNIVSANPCSSNDKYAQNPDGCSSWSNNGRQVRDSWGPVNFTPACNKHDICYYTLGTSEASCNNAFLKNLKDECQYGLRRFPDPARMLICLGIATTMYTGVRAASRSVYRKAQKKQRRHENQCNAKSSNNASSGAIISLRTNNGHYVVAEGGGGSDANANRTQIGPWEKFTMINFDREMFAFKTSNGHYLVAEGGGGGAMNGNRTKAQGWEKFKLISKGGNKVCLQTNSGHYVVAENGGGGLLNANRSQCQGWETFELIRH